MRFTLTAVALTLLAVSAVGLDKANEKSPIVSSPMDVAKNPDAVAVSKKRGAATAAKDIEAGTLRILYYGKPWSAGKPLVDDATGFRVQIIGGCASSEPFRAEVEAYNSIMRAFHAKKTSAKDP